MVSSVSWCLSATHELACVLWCEADHLVQAGEASGVFVKVGFKMWLFKVMWHDSLFSS